ncbi:MAG TPA: ATP-binding protein [Terriglobales bacterium]|nr:ATP-binding protein [Terriglobales bacterium]
MHFLLPGDVSVIGPTVDRVTALARQEWGTDSEKLGDMGLALQEALANAVVHGCRRDPAKSVECWVACDQEQGVLIVVSDPGPGFDLASLPDPKSPRHLQKDHGRGIYLICELMDEVHFRREGAEIHMRKS